MVGALVRPASGALSHSRTIVSRCHTAVELLRRSSSCIAAVRRIAKSSSHNSCTAVAHLLPVEHIFSGQVHVAVTARPGLV